MIKWGLLVAVLGTIVAWPYLCSRVDEEIRARVEAKFAANYPNLRVTVSKAQLIKGRGIEIRGLSIVDPRATGRTAELASFDEIFLTCETGWTDLAGGEPQIHKIEIRRPVIRATRQTDGTWSAGKMLPLPKFGDRCADSITIENATLEMADATRGQSGPMLLRDINLELTPQANDANSGAAPDCRPMKVQGSLAADHAQRIEFSGQVDPKNKTWAIAGKVQALDLSPELKEALPADVGERCTLLESLRGQADVDFRVQYDPLSPQALSFDVSGELARGRLDDPRLPYPLMDLHAKLHADNSGITIEDCSARNGQTSLWLSGTIGGYAAGCRVSLDIQGQNVELTRQMVDVLPPTLRATWEKFLPAGRIDADVKLSYDGQRWRPDLKVTCREVAFTFYRFPYRLERGTGWLTLKDDKLVLKLTAFGGGQPLRIDGEFEHPGPQFTGSADVSGNNVPFDENLLAALPGKTPEVARSLNLRGTFNFKHHCQRDDPNDPTVHQQLTVDVNRGALRYEKFPYPISNICGRLEMVDQHWRFADLEGNNDSGVIRCTGHLDPLSEGVELGLEFDATDVLLEAELRDALPPGPQKLWNDMRMHGSIDLKADVRYLSAKKALDVELWARPRDGTSIEPIYFPYRLEKLAGQVHYRNGHVDLDGIHGMHGRVPVSTKGYGDQNADGNWHLHLEDLTADRFNVDEPELFAALPAALKKVVQQLKPKGPVSLAGTIDLAGKTGEPVRSQWDVKVFMEPGRIDCGVQLENIRGAVQLAGKYDGQHAVCHGELAVSSLTYKDFQFTDITGPLWVDDGRVLMGALTQTAEANRTDVGTGGPARRLSAKVYGGTMAADGWVTLNGTPQYSLIAQLIDADLTSFAQEALPGRQKLKGKVLANVQLNGSAMGLHTLNGGGQVRLTDADIYELPLMVALLKILSVRPPDTTAFTRSDITFRVQGDHIYLNPITFSGDAISLEGAGEMNLDTDIRLDFYTVAGRTERQIPILKNVLGQASYNMMQIHVDGTLAQPRTRTEVLPGVNKALQQLQSDMQKPLDPSAAPPMGRTIPREELPLR